MRSITILGSTGSIGASALDLIRRNRADWRVIALTARSQARELAELAREFGAEMAAISDESRLPELREALAGSGIEAAGGEAGLIEAFPDLDEMTEECPRGCTHGADEPECGLDEAMERGEADPERVESFRRLLASRESVD